MLQITRLFELPAFVATEVLWLRILTCFERVHV